MKNIIPGLILLLTISIANANGLEKIIVEKYYVSDANDSKATNGHLHIGSVTYRIYVDMLPGYRFQAAFGIPGHELRIATSTSFYNNEDYGAVIPNVIPNRNLNENTVMLDSWLSVGGASESNLGILKSEDEVGGAIVNKNGLLQNTDLTAGIPLKSADGFISGTPEHVTEFGIDSVIKIFGNHNIEKNGQEFFTLNGSWASMNGSVGPADDNKVLIAQITTDGIFTFELNVQLGTPDGGVEQYVAKNASGNEILFPGLNYSSAGLDISPKSKVKIVADK